MPLKAAARTGRPPRHLRGTLYACRSRNPLVSGFSTYSIGQAIVPVLFREYPPESELSGLKTLRRLKPQADGTPNSAPNHRSIGKNPNKIICFGSSHFSRECCNWETVFPVE
jgi:hypothetical protein